MTKRAVFFIVVIAIGPRGARAAVETVLVSSAAASSMKQGMHRPAISGDGRFVAFDTTDRLLPEDNNTLSDVYLFDRREKTLRMVHGDPKRWNNAPAVNRDGSMVAFQSYPLSSITGKGPRVSEIVLFDRVSGRRAWASRLRPEVVLDGEALQPTMDGLGRFVLFTSNASIVNGKRRPPIRAVYVNNRRLGQIELISQTVGGVPANRPSAEAKISSDGRFVAYLSAATNLAGGLPLGSLAYRIYLFDRWKWTQIRVDEASRGFDPNRWIPGRFAFSGSADVLVFEAHPRDDSSPQDVLQKTDLFLFLRAKDTVVRLTDGIFEGRSVQPSVSRDGRFIAFVLLPSETGDPPGGLVIHDRKKDKWLQVVGGPVSNPAISDDGSTVAFESDRSDLAGGPAGNAARVYFVGNPLKE